jgi:hypothetical protein
MTPGDVNELNILTQAMNTVNERICSCDFRGLLSGVAEGSFLVYAVASWSNRIPTIRQNFLASCKKIRTLLETAKAARHVRIGLAHDTESYGRRMET